MAVVSLTGLEKEDFQYSMSETAVKSREAKDKGEKERYTHLNAEFLRIARRDKKAFSVINAKKQRKTKEWERLKISSRKLEIPREDFMQIWAQ